MTEDYKYSSLKIDTDAIEADKTATQILHLMDRFIPDACRNEAYQYLRSVCYKEGIELTSKLMRKQYEEWKKLTLNTGLISTDPNGDIDFGLMPLNKEIKNDE